MSDAQSATPRDSVSIPREDLDAAYRYIQHVGANAVMRGEPHPQQWIVDKLEAALACASSEKPRSLSEFVHADNATREAIGTEVISGAISRQNAAPQAPCAPRQSSPGPDESLDSPNAVSHQHCAGGPDETDSGVQPAVSASVDKAEGALVTVREDVVRFLLGEGPLEGAWFGDINSARQAPFWWRTPLRLSMHPFAASSAIPRWVACSECTPDVGGHLWAILTDKREHGKHTGYIPLFEYYSLIDGWATDDNVTHWLDCKLPQFPRVTDRRTTDV